MSQLEIRPSPPVDRLRDVDAVLAVVVNLVVLNREVQGKAAEDAVVPSVSNWAAVVMAVVVLNDDVGSIRTVVLVAEDGNPRSWGPGDLEAIDRDVAARAQLDPVLRIGPLSSRRDLGAAFVLRLENDASGRGSTLAVTGEASVRAVRNRNRVPSGHRPGSVLDGLPGRRRAPGCGVVPARTDEVVLGPGVDGVPGYQKDREKAEDSHDGVPVPSSGGKPFTWQRNVRP